MGRRPALLSLVLILGVAIPGFRPVFWRPNQNITVIVMSNLDRAAFDNLTSGIAVRFDPQLLPAYQKRWPATDAKN